MNTLIQLILTALLSTTMVYAAQVSAIVNSTGAETRLIGEVIFTQVPYGLLITPDLAGLPAGLHGFHLHEIPDCGSHGMNAGGHFDPAKTDSHQGPYGSGHLGYLPVLFVTKDGKANTPLLAPRLKLKDITGLTVMIHAKGDNYSNTPPLGGGGDREACGVIKTS